MKYFFNPFGCIVAWNTKFITLLLLIYFVVIYKKNLTAEIKKKPKRRKKEKKKESGITFETTKGIKKANYDL